MDTDEVLGENQKNIEALIDAKLKPVLGFIAGLELAVVHILARFHQTGYLPYEEELKSVVEIRDGLREDEPPEVRVVLQHIEQWLEQEAELARQLDAPAASRPYLRLIPGDLFGESPKDKM
ncbi:hypothetical protein [Telmatospirillum sp.]|uniref:hypothetical protein n=1 Tax=Telmatospirillum sp. TaxID=2079197 RepID=UPI00283FD714|nr:hypothetical protein [Telmatospirillum sp.]MDR3438643.1 hypothetical protein [Telmatospirillum sp.]